MMMWVLITDFTQNIWGCSYNIACLFCRSYIYILDLPIYSTCCIEDTVHSIWYFNYQLLFLRWLTLMHINPFSRMRQIFQAIFLGHRTHKSLATYHFLDCCKQSLSSQWGWTHNSLFVQLNTYINQFAIA